MTREITQGQIDRYVLRAQSLYGTTKYFEWVSTQPVYLGRRAMLKALRGFMSTTRRQQRRAIARSPYRHRKTYMRLDESAGIVDVLPKGTDLSSVLKFAEDTESKLARAFS